MSHWCGTRDSHNLVGSFPKHVPFGLALDGSTPGAKPEPATLNWIDDLLAPDDVPVSPNDMTSTNT